MRASYLIGRLADIIGYRGDAEIKIQYSPNDEGKRLSNTVSIDCVSIDSEDGKILIEIE